MPAAYSLYELTEYLRRVIALNFPEPIWVHGEIAQIKEVRGNVYLDLVYHDEASNEITAQIAGNIWYKSNLFLKNKLGNLLPSLLIQGTHVQLKVQVEYSEKYGMKLIVEDIDPSFTIGQMEMKRQKIIQRLEDEGLTALNKKLAMPMVIQNIAVISSATAAGYADFMHQLDQNAYGYRYKVTLFQASLQGLNTEKEVCAAFESIQSSDEHFDIIIIIRGGGAKPDLAWFDNYNIGAGIAKSKLPVITGIGHEIDITVADIVANQSLKTPTAVADFIIERSLDFESQVIEIASRISYLVQRIIKENAVSLANISQWIKVLPADILRKNKQNVQMLHDRINEQSKYFVSNQKRILDLIEEKLIVYDPQNTLKRGYTLVFQDGHHIPSFSKYVKGLPLEIKFYDNTTKIDTHE